MFAFVLELIESGTAVPKKTMVIGESLTDSISLSELKEKTTDLCNVRPATRTYDHQKRGSVTFLAGTFEPN